MQIRKELVSLALLLGSWSFLSISLMAQESINLRQSCSSLRNIALPDTVISISEVVEANNFSPSNSSSSLDTPSFCRVVGVIEPAINFEVWLPLSDWNGKYNGKDLPPGTYVYKIKTISLLTNEKYVETETKNNYKFFAEFNKFLAFGCVKSKLKAFFTQVKN